MTTPRDGTRPGELRPGELGPGELRPGEDAETRSPAAPSGPSRLVTVARFASLLDAQLARARLAAEGIEAHVPDERSASVLGEQFDALGGIRLRVRSAAAERASALLQPAQREAAKPTPPPSCVVCGSPRPEPPADGPLGFLRQLLPRRARPCAVCGHRPERTSRENSRNSW